MKKNLIKLLSLLFLLSRDAYAGTVIATNINDPASDIVVADVGGDALSGTIVAVGWYDVGFDVSLAVASGDYASLSSASNFNVLVSTLTGDTNVAFESSIAGYFVTNNQDYGAPSGGMAGSQLYVLFGNAATLDGVNTQYALVRFNETIGSDSPLADSNSLQLSGGSYTILAGTTSTAVVDLSSIGGSATESNQSLQLVTVPEPSAALLGGLGALALLRRRRVA